MAQRKQLTWTELRVGLFVLVGLFILAVGIFYVTGATFIGPKYRLKTYLPEVSDLANGAPVRVDGVEVGNVESIKLVPRTPGRVPEKNKNIEVVMRIDRRFQGDILTDSTASLVTEGLLGNRVVNITRGFTGVPLKEGQEITGTEEKAIREVVERRADVLANLQALSDNAKDLLAGVQEGRGTLGKLVASDELYGKVNAAVDSVNIIMSDVRSQKGTLGKLLYDPSLYDEAKKALSSGNAVLSDVREGKGTLGKLATDDALYNKLRETSSNLASATAKLNENTTTVGKMFSDPQLYDNLTGLTGDLRLLIGDFRQNPKKFLHFKITVF